MERAGRSERRRREEAGGPGWLATLAGALLLIVAGFGVGLVAGAAFEEPDLVMDHLAGRTTEVPLADATAAPVAEPAPVAAGEPSPAAAPAEPARRPLGAPRDAGAPPPVAAAPPAARPSAAPPPRPAAPAPQGAFAIQVGAFGERGGADALVRTLREAGFPANVVEEGGAARYKVRVGPLASRADADRLAVRLRSEHRLPTWVVSRGR